MAEQFLLLIHRGSIFTHGHVLTYDVSPSQRLRGAAGTSSLKVMWGFRNQHSKIRRLIMFRISGGPFAEGYTGLAMYMFKFGKC